MKDHPCIIHGHATTWHDGGAAFLLRDGSLVALASERVGDRFKHSWNSRLAYDYILKRLSGSDKFRYDSKHDLFQDPANGLVNDGHHLNHAASTFFASSFDDAAVLVVDGQGPERGRLTTTSIWKGNKIRGLEFVEDNGLVDEKFGFNSIGHFYTAIGALAGMQNLHEEGKTMGLASYGKPSKFLDFFRSQVYSNPDGSYHIDPKFIYAVLGNTFGPKYFGWSLQSEEVQIVWDKIMSLRSRPLRQLGEQVSQEDMDIAYAGQSILEDLILGLAKRAKKLTGSQNICLAGGVALNSVANGKVLNSGIFKKVYIFPAAGDDGQAIGRLFLDIHSRGLDVDMTSDKAYYGPDYNHEEIALAIQRYAPKVKIASIKEEESSEGVADMLDFGKVIGVFNGRSEIGPRSLGNRSILADPRRTNMRQYVNDSVKGREWFRPLAPVVLEENMKEYFNLQTPSPFMLIVGDVLKDKREVLPAITHVDNTARVQTVNESQNPFLHRLVKRFAEKTGVPVLLNTSFNRPSEPIVESPSDALESFTNMNLDALLLENVLVVKK